MIRELNQQLEAAMLKAAQKVIEQGEPCTSDGACQYYHDKQRCAVGWMMPLDVAMSAPTASIGRALKYGDVAEGLGREVYGDENHVWSPHEIEVLRAFQGCHDMADSLHFLADFEFTLREHFGSAFVRQLCWEAK